MALPPWLAPPQFEHEDRTRLAKNLTNIFLTVLGFQIIFAIVLFLAPPETSNNILYFIGLGIFYTLGCYLLMLKGRLTLASVLFCILLSFSTLGMSFYSNGLNSMAIQTFTVVILITGLLLGSRYGFTFAVLGALTVFLLFLLELNGWSAFSQVSTPPLFKIIIPAFVFMMSAILLHHSTQNIHAALQKAQENEAALFRANAELQAIQTTLEQRIEERTSQLQASIEIGQTISNILDPEELGKQVIHKFITHFAYDFAGIYFLDEAGRSVVLKYSNLNETQSAQAKLHRVDLTQANSITNALHTQKPSLTCDILYSVAHFPSLPGSMLRTDISLPLQASGRLLGVLNLQAYDDLALTNQDIELLQNVANQIAIAFENARLFNETQAQFQEINRLNQFYLQTTWRALLTEELPAYQFSAGELKEISTPDEAVLEKVRQEQKIHAIQNEDGTSTLIAPVLFQDQVLGVAQFTAQDRRWTADEIALVEAVLNQTALSLENNRLIVETRSRADQEKMISEISNRMRETLDLETILQTTALEMQKTFGLSEVEVRLLPLTQQALSDTYPPTSGE